MITIQLGCVLPLPCGISDIKGFAINPLGFLFLESDGCRLIKCLCDASEPELIELEKKYNCICYDSCENCYWAISEAEPTQLFRLDQSFREVGHITLGGSCQHRAVGLCCDGCGIWIAYSCQLAFWDKNSEQVTWFKNENSRRSNRGFIAQCECRVTAYCEGGRQFVEIESPRCCDSAELAVPKGYRLVGMAPGVEEQKCDCCCFYLLLSKVCSRELSLFKYCVDFSENQPPICHAHHDGCHGPSHCCKKRSMANRCGAYEVMHSIALEESGISHILNAEGEKIQKAVAISDNIEDLICVNESVKRTLTQVTLLEGMLYSKLETLVFGQDSCGCHPEPPCPPPCPPCCGGGQVGCK